MKTIPARLLDQAARLGDRTALRYKTDGAWKEISWNDYAAEVRAAAKSLIALGMEAGDTTAVLGFNTPEWVFFDVATMMAGGVPAGIYTTNSPGECKYILEHSEAKVVLVENGSQWAKIDEVRSELPHLLRAVTMRRSESIEHEFVAAWEAFLALGTDVSDEDLDARLAALEDDQLATFIYTSGTTGPPKAVMLSHRNLAWTSDCAANDLADLTDADRMLSYLPLSHIAEQIFTIHAPITKGCTVSFAESLQLLPENLKEVKPTVMFGVPRIWEKMYAKVNAGLTQATGFRKMLADWALGVGRRVTAEKNRGNQPGGLLGLQYAIANKLVFTKVKGAMGLDEARICVTGAAPISAEILEFFAGLDLTIHEVYGQSEDCGPTTFNPIGGTKFGTVGPPIPGTDVRIATDGEIQVKGPHVFLGYYKNPEATAETLSDGYLLTGDLGEFDADGYLKITGRKKDIIITAGGKNIAPKNIEAAIKDIDIVSQAVVIGDRRKFLSALITLAREEDATIAFAKEHGLELDTMHTSDLVRDYLQGAIDEQVNPQFARVEHIRKFQILPRDFTIQDNELTPTLKIKRKFVNENWADTIESMYA